MATPTAETAHQTAKRRTGLIAGLVAGVAVIAIAGAVLLLLGVVNDDAPVSPTPSPSGAESSAPKPSDADAGGRIGFPMAREVRT